MSGIPDDIREAAAKALNEAEGMIGTLFSDRLEVMAKAIHAAVMAERERCARLMEDDGEWTFAGDPAAMAIFEDVRELAADAIRAAPKGEA